MIVARSRWLEVDHVPGALFVYNLQIVNGVFGLLTSVMSRNETRLLVVLVLRSTSLI